MTENLKWQDWKSESGEGRRNYVRHVFTLKEKTAMLFICVGIGAGLSFFFYRSVIAFPFMCVIGAAFCTRMGARKAAEDRRKLLLQFRDMIWSAAAGMRAGYSVENAFLESYSDMCLMHGEDSFICEEIRLIKSGITLNLTIEELLDDLGVRSALSQIKEFAGVFSIAKKSGGSMASIITASAEVIGRKIETQEEILTQTSGRRMECMIMNLMPFGIMIYIGISNPGYFDMLYHNLYGVLIMSGCLSAYLAAYLMSERILDRVAGDWK